MCLHKFVKLVANSVPCKKILHWANVCFGTHSISQLYRHTTGETFAKAFAMNIRYEILNVASVQEWDLTAQMVWWFHAGNVDQWSPRSLRDLIISTVNLNRKFRQLLQKKIKIFQRHMLSKACCHFPDVGRRTNVSGEEAIADHKVEEYKNKLQDYWRSSKLDFTISKS